MSLNQGIFLGVLFMICAVVLLEYLNLSPSSGGRITDQGCLVLIEEDIDKCMNYLHEIYKYRR